MKLELTDMEFRNSRANQYMIDAGVRLIHINKQVSMFNITGARPPGTSEPARATVAFRMLEDAPFVEIAVAYCSPNDEFVKRVGKILAVEKFAAGNVWRVRVPPKSQKNLWRLVDMIRATLAPSLTWQ